MAEVTHEDILNRIAATEHQGAETMSVISRIEERTDRAVEGVERNRQNLHQIDVDLQELKGELRGLRWGLGGVAALIATGTAVLGILLQAA